ncbi:hypothetical protein J8281_17675 [Aquimarina sp. U1-2]|uniref:hypothetical protein n=1 Tax=Aquimarina sp. U1-2 TaxID=2823141 RepID=UPI001AED0BD9|nr:hypothetical protein [Aquimarina sp. U1-2]MBP2834030.1 hypothetical protein [Aquimarina sp. U1-2]
MIENKFIITTIFYFLLAGMITFKLGPDIIIGGKSVGTATFEFSTIDSIALNFHNANNNYLNLRIKKDTMSFLMQFYTPERDEKALMNLLYEYNIISNKQSYKNEIPKKITKKDLRFITSVKLILEDKNDLNSSINFCSINDHKIKGHNVKFRRVITIILGYLLTISGLLGLIIIPISAYFQIKDYREEGVKPSGFPNRYEGINNFLKGFSGIFKSNGKKK